MRKIMSITAILLSTILNLQTSHANTWQTCKKWVLDALGVVCKDTPKGTHAAGLIFFDKICSKEWQFHSATYQYPFETVLPGPGLEGPTVTVYGEMACEQFCIKYQKSIG